MSAYLFVHFTSDKNGDNENVYFALSHDGLNWKDLGGESPILSTEKGTRGIRDPFIVYDKTLKKYFIIATDLNTKSGDWYDFSHNGSKSLFVWESDDLINWSNERLCAVGVEKAGCVWAPEAVFCEEKGEWFVFFASCVKEEDETGHKQRIYGTFTKDFKNFSPAFKYIDAQTDIIDTDIVRDGEYYYRFSKDETNKVIILEKSRRLISDCWEHVYSEVLDNTVGVEGPEAYYIEQKGTWCLIADQYRYNEGYTPFLCENLESGKFYKLGKADFNMGKRKKRHGGVIKISDETADKLIKYYGENK